MTGDRPGEPFTLADLPPLAPLGMPDGWVTDVLGDDYRALTLPLADDDEGEVVATLVRHDPGLAGLRPARAVLYVHGWSDYFFQTGLAEFWTAQGIAFYALDLRKYGRSLRDHQTPGYVETLVTYDEEIDAALATIHAELGPHCAVLLTAHSTGGLVTALWADRHPGRVTGLALNSPWLELQGSSIARTVSTPAVAQIARFHPRTLPGGDAAAFVRDSIRQAPRSYTATVTVHAPAEQVRERARWFGGTVEECDEASCTLTVRGDSLSWLGACVGLVEADYTLHGPPELAVWLQEFASRVGRAGYSA